MGPDADQKLRFEANNHFIRHADWLRYFCLEGFSRPPAVMESWLPVVGLQGPSAPRSASSINIGSAQKHLL